MISFTSAGTSAAAATTAFASSTPSATVEQAQEIHAEIRKVLAEKFGDLAQEISILYGGSCNPTNAQELFACPDIDGGLIGGAALKADSFKAIALSF